MSDEELKALADAFRQKLALDPEIRAAEKKIAEGKADFSDTSRMFWRRSELLGDYMQGIVPDLAPEDRERLAEALLRMGYNDTNGVLVPLQEALDEPLGVHLTPVVPKYPAERVATVAHALMDPTVPEEKIVRRAGAPVANVNMSFHDKYMEENARIRARLGMKPTITRYGSGCCKWCSEVAGRYRFGEQPKDIFRRHDNCGCTIIYDNQVLRGHRNEGGGSSRAWEEVDPEEVMRNGFEPVRFSEEQAKKLQDSQLKLLTKPGQGDIIDTGHKMAASDQQAPDFSKYEVHVDLEAVQAIKKMMIDELGIPENQIDLTGIKNADVLGPFMNRWKRIQKDTGMKFPPIKTLEIIYGDETCVANFRSTENVFYISSRFFNSKDALIDTLKDWSENKIMPKQCKSIAFLAEHEAAHIRYSDKLNDIEAVKSIHLDFMRSKFSNKNDRKISEFVADSVAWYRVSPSNLPPKMGEMIAFLDSEVRL